MLRRRHRGARLLELSGQAALLLGGSLAVGPPRPAGGGVAVAGALGRAAGVTATAEHDPALGEVGPRQLGDRRGVLGPAACLLDGGGGHDARGRAHAPSGGREAVAFGGDHHEVVAGQREVDGLLPAVDADGPADERVEHRLGDRPAVAGPHVAPDRFGTAARGQRAGSRRARRRPRRQDRPGHTTLAEGRQRGLGRAPPVDHDGGHAGTDGGLERGVPALVDLDQVDQRTDDAVDIAQQLAPAGALQVGQRALERLGPGRRAVAGLLRLVRRHLGRLRRPHGLLELPRRAPPARPPTRRSPTRARPPAWPEGRHAPPHRSYAPEGCRPAPPARRGPPAPARRRGRPTRCGPAPGRWPGRARRRRAPRPSAPAAPPPPDRASPAPPRAPPARARRPPPPRPRPPPARWPAAPPRPRATRPRRRRRRRRGRPPRPRLRSRRTPDRPRARSTSPCTRPGRVGQVLFAARRQLGRGGSRLGVELLERLVQLSLLLAAHRQVLGRGEAAGREVGLLGAGEVPPHHQQLARHPVVRARRCGLALEGPDLAAHLAHQVAQALEVLRRGGQPPLGPLPAAPVLEHAGGLLDDGPAVLGSGVEHRVQLALADDHVLLAADARVAEQLLDVEQPAGRPVDGVLAVARAEERPGDGDLGQVDGQLARRVVDGERDFGPAELGARTSRRR